MAPVVTALGARGDLDVKVVVTAQHRGMLDQVLRAFAITPDHDLDLMTDGQSLDTLAARILATFGPCIDDIRPDRVLVHGDTLTTAICTLAAYFRKIPVGHVEAGLRSGDKYSPWPEEGNRRLTGVLADLHFAPTETAAAALRRENVDEDTIHLTGNTVIDALLAMRERIEAEPELADVLLPLAKRFQSKRIIAVTSHRRENFGEGMKAIGRALRRIAEREDVAIIFPVHPNPQVRPVMNAMLRDRDNVALIDPLDYANFVALLAKAELVLTDSGGVQEEAPSLGKPVLVMRDTTERPEGVAAGTARLVGTDEDGIVSGIFTLLDDEAMRLAMQRAHNPYGDGHAAERIARIIGHVHALD